MISEMAAVEILGPIELFTASVDVIQESGALHIVETPLAEFGQADLLSKIHLTENQAAEREDCARTTGTLDELTAEIPAHIARALGSSRDVGMFYTRWNAAGAEAVATRARVLHARVRSFVRRERNLTDDITSVVRL